MSDRLPPLYALRAFEVAARSSSFTRAAEELSLTQSAISRHIRNLETVLGCRLFERHGPKLLLTEAGQRLADELGRGFRIIEAACHPLRTQGNQLRLKAPSTLTMRWLLQALERFNSADASAAVQLSSVWMDIDTVDFQAEPYDCAVLLGNGQFGADIDTCKLFDEWLLPICAADQAPSPWPLERLDTAELIHPSADRRDWRRWLQRVYPEGQVPLARGKVFDTLDQGIAAAMAGHGVSMGDLHLIAADLARGLLGLPVPIAISTGDSYYLAWPRDSAQLGAIRHLKDWLLGDLPDICPIAVERRA